MKRRLLQLCFAIGLLLTLVAGTLWVRGFWIADSWLIRPGGAGDGLWRVGTDSTSIIVSFNRWKVPEGLPPEALRPDVSHRSDPSAEFSLIVWPDESLPLWNRIGFFYSSGGEDTLSGWQVGAPSWFAVLLCILATTVSGRYVLRERQRMSRLRRSLCPTCGYDLRGADHDRCPECGTAVDVARV
ncbi:MAG TPA: hypothetical protein VGR35_19295 [Tepidisphaeraceae bacterium]|nr:hypothetical protein [Tepidisphaeraceae bacterium]